MNENLLLFNLAADADDPILGFAMRWIDRLAAHFARVDVITMRVGRVETSSNVHVFSVGKERGWGEARRAAEFYRLLAARLAERRYAACFAHMMPLFAAMGAPLLRARGVPITLWYTHRQRHRTLELATRVSRRVVTAVPDSFPIPTPKLRPIGHGIDTSFYAPAPQPTAEPLIVHIARLMPIKHQATLIHALAAMPEIRAAFIGGVPPDAPSDYAAGLHELAQTLGVAGRITWAGDQSAVQVRAWYHRAAAAVNLSPAGLFDKAALESMACAVPTVVSSAAFDSLLGEDAPRLRIDQPDDAAGLAERLRGLVALPAEARMTLGTRLRERVVAAHSLDALVPRLVSVLLTGEPEAH